MNPNDAPHLFHVGKNSEIEREGENGKDNGVTKKRHGEQTGTHETQKHKFGKHILAHMNYYAGGSVHACWVVSYMR